jgi:hypothetical protein
MIEDDPFRKIDTSTKKEPEPQIEDFPNRRKKESKNLENFNIDEYRPLMSKIINFLMMKAVHEKRKQDKFNPTQLGNVRFHIQYIERTKESKLVFSLHPKQWKISDINKDIDNREAEIMTQRHFDQMVMDDPFHNPFTY